MLKQTSNAFYAVSTWYTILASIIIYGLFLSQVMAPQAAEMQALASSWGAPDGHLFYTPDKLYAELALWSEAGRQHYIDFRLGLDPVWALVYTAFLVTVTSVALGRGYPVDHPQRMLNLFALLPMSADIIENFFGIALVSAWPDRMDSIAWLTACITFFKWSTLVLAHLLMVYAIFRAFKPVKLADRPR